MSDTGRGTNIRLQGYTLRVPVAGDEKTTEAIVEDLNNRLAIIEENAERVDTLGFALRLAYDLASELHQAKSQSDADLRDTLKALDQLQSRLNQLADQVSPPAE